MIQPIGPGQDLEDLLQSPVDPKDKKGHQKAQGRHEEQRDQHENDPHKQPNASCVEQSLYQHIHQQFQGVSAFATS